MPQTVSPCNDQGRELAHEDFCKFKGLRIWDQFFDPECGETFEKIAADRGRCFSGGDAFEGKEAGFSGDESVQFLDPVEAQACGHRERLAAERP